LNKKVDRRLELVGLFFFVGVANFITGPSEWLRLPNELYTVLIGQALLGFFTGGCFALSVPEIKAGIDSDNFTPNQIKQKSEKAASIYGFVYGIGNILTPFAAGALQDYAGWRFTTDVLAKYSVVLAVLYGVVILVGCLCLPNYWTKKQGISKMEQGMKLKLA